jgi:hypothetical protein
LIFLICILGTALPQQRLLLLGVGNIEGGSPPASYTFTYIGCAAAVNSGSGTTLATSTFTGCTATLNVAAGDSLIAFSSFYGATTTNAVSDGASNSFTFESANNNNDARGALGYILSTTANATATFTQTVGAARTYRSIYVLQFRKTGGTVSRDTGSGAATGSSTTPTSGTVSTAAGAVVVGSEWDGNLRDISTTDPNEPKIAGVDANGWALETATTSAGVWYTIFANAQTDITAGCTLASSGAWICNILSLKAQ